jgi:hypothetical protein
MATVKRVIVIPAYCEETVIGASGTRPRADTVVSLTTIDG